MRKRVKSAARWPCNGAAYSARYRSQIDSIALFSSAYARQLSSTYQPSLQAVNHHGGRSNAMPCCRSHAPQTRASAKRQFSALGQLRSGGFDDVDDFDSSAKSSISAMIRQRVDPVKQAAELARQKKEQEEAEEARRQKAQQDQWFSQRQEVVAQLDKLEEAVAVMLQEKWQQNVQEVMNRAASFSATDVQLFEQLYYIKYPKSLMIHASLGEIHAHAKHYEAELLNCRQLLRRINLASRRIKLETRLAHLATDLGLLADSLNSVVTPNARAKQTIDSILGPLAHFQKHYSELQDAGLKMHLGLAKIEKRLRALSKEGNHARLHVETVRLQVETGELRSTSILLLHSFRTVKRLAMWFSPMGQSQVFGITTNHNNGAGKLIIEDAIGVPLRYGSYSRRVAFCLSQWYLQQPSDSIAWKHLDVIYPFDVLITKIPIISRSCEEIIALLVKSGRHKSIRNDLLDWVRRASVTNANLQADISVLKYCTWLRLVTESRVCSLGDIPDTISRGLFNPLKPLSFDTRQFIVFVDTVRKDIELTDRIQDDIDNAHSSDRRSPSQTNHEGLEEEESTTTSEEILMIIPEESQQDPSIPEPTHLPTFSESSSTQATNVDETHGEETTSGRNRGGVKEVRPDTISNRAGIGAFRTKDRFTISRRGYSTNSRALLSDQQPECGVAQTDIALTDNHPTRSLQSMESQNEDTIITTVSGTQVSEVISSNLSADESAEPPNPGFESTRPQYWSYNQHKGPDGGNIVVHYCKTLDSAERVARLFSGSELIGFDIEWKAQATSTSGIKSNVSVIQIANAERIALFHLAVFRPGNEVHELIPPSLRELLESASTMKAGVCIKADCSRIYRHLGIQVRGQLELSHLYKLVKFSQTQPKMVDRRTVNLSQQVEELLGLPLRKDSDVRRSDWTRPLDYTQVQYAASDAYACICLHRILDAKRKSLTPIPPMPAYAELNMPILLVDETSSEKKVVQEEERQAPSGDNTI